MAEKLVLECGWLDEKITAPLVSCFPTLLQAIAWADYCFGQGRNLYILSRDDSAYWVTTPAKAETLLKQGYQLLYGH